MTTTAGLATTTDLAYDNAAIAAPTITKALAVDVADNYTIQCVVTNTNGVVIQTATVTAN